MRRVVKLVHSSNFGLGMQDVVVIEGYHHEVVTFNRSPRATLRQDLAFLVP